MNYYEKYFLTKHVVQCDIQYITIEFFQDSINSLLAILRKGRKILSKTCKSKKHGSETLENDSTFHRDKIPKMATKNKPPARLDLQNTNMISQNLGHKNFLNFQGKDQLLYA